MIGSEFTGGNDRRNQIAVRQRFDGRLSRVEGCAIHIIRRAANIVTSTTHAASSAVSSAGTSAAASATGHGALIRVWRRRESVTGRRVGAHVTAITGIPAHINNNEKWFLIDPFRDKLTDDQSVGYSELCGCIYKEAWGHSTFTFPAHVTSGSIVADDADDVYLFFISLGWI